MAKGSRTIDVEGKIKDTFWKRVLILSDEECWVWMKAKNSSGYGWVFAGGTNHLAHRVAWVLTNGPISDGLCVLHRCDTPACCNPDHLFLGTDADNVRDRDQKKRTACGSSVSIRGERHGMSKLKNWQVYEIRRLWDLGIDRHEIAARFSLTIRMVFLIGCRRNWKHLEERAK